MMETLNLVFGYAFGIVFVVVLMSFIYKRDAIDWDQLVSVYGRAWQPPRLRKRFANMILYSEGRPAKSYKGIIEIGLLDDGIALRPNPILVPFQKAIFIPYTDIQGWKQEWYLDAKSAELSFRKTPQMRMIMPRDQVEWMLTLTGGAVQISENPPPHGTRPWATYIVAWTFFIWALALVIFGLVNGLPMTKQAMARHTSSLQLAGEP